MTLTGAARKAVLTAHVVTSVGWLGAVLAYLALDVAATTGDDVSTVRAAYVAMDVVVRTAIVPLAVAAVAIGVVNALGTPWGLVRHHWVIAKLVLSAVALGVLLIEAGPVARLAELATTGADPRSLPGTLPHSIGGAALLLLVTVLSVVKPRGVTRRGRRATVRPVASRVG